MDIGSYLRAAWATFAKDSYKDLLTFQGGWPQYSANGRSLVRLGLNNLTDPNLAPGAMYDTDCPTIQAGVDSISGQIPLNNTVVAIGSTSVPKAISFVTVAAITIAVYIL